MVMGSTKQLETNIFSTLLSSENEVGWEGFRSLVNFVDRHSAMLYIYVKIYQIEISDIFDQVQISGCYNKYLLCLTLI